VLVVVSVVAVLHTHLSVARQAVLVGVAEKDTKTQEVSREHRKVYLFRVIPVSVTFLLLLHVLVMMVVLGLGVFPVTLLPVRVHHSVHLPVVVVVPVVPVVYQ
jgi:hypothetical protein